MSSTAQRRKKKADKSKKPAPWQEECVPITVEQFQLANKVAHAAASGQMPRQSFSSVFEEAQERGEVGPGPRLILKDIPMNHAAFAVMDLVPEKTDEGDKLRRSLLWRALLMPDRIFDDPRSQAYRQLKGDQEYVGAPLIEAMSTVPVNVGMEPPLDAIFARAAELAATWDRHADPEFEE